MADAKTLEHGDREWWDAWFEADYSWDGLAGHTIGGEGGLHGEKTLQDYWRRDPTSGAVRDDAAMQAAGEVVTGADGRLWHIVHQPKGWKDRVPTWKADTKHPDWARVRALADARLRAGDETQTDQQGNAKGLEGRALLRGAVIARFDGHPDGRDKALYINADQMAVLNSTDCRLQVFYAGRFVSASFAGRAWFNSASFVGDAWFEGTSFAGDTWFQSTSFAGEARFSRVRFAREARFDSVRFAHDAVFEGTTFASLARFVSAGFAGHAWFRSSNFAGLARFASASFAAEARFADARFCSDADFVKASFAGEARFASASFARAAQFDSASFASDGGFSNASFAEFAAFGGASFAGLACFASASFAGPARFDGASFAGRADFSGAAEILENGKNAQILSLKFVQPPGPDDAPGMAPLGVVATGEITTPATYGPLQRRFFRHVSFAGAKFERDADFSNRSFLAETDFSNALFGGLALFHDARLHQNTSFNGTDFRTPSHLPSDIYVGFKYGQPQYRQSAQHERLLQSDAHFAAYERAYRTLKLVMEGHRARREEARFYRLELEARRQRPARRFHRAEMGESAPAATKETPSSRYYWLRPVPRGGRDRETSAVYKDVTAAEKAASYIYGWTSSYGDSLLRPMLSLVALCIVFTLIYGLLSGSFLLGTPPMCDPDAECSIGKVLETLAAFSAERTFLPFVQQEESDATMGWWVRATQDAPLIPFVLGFLHRLLAAAFIFLFLLALRRRFQMN